MHISYPHRAEMFVVHIHQAEMFVILIHQAEFCGDLIKERLLGFAFELFGDPAGEILI